MEFLLETNGGVCFLCLQENHQDHDGSESNSNTSSSSSSILSLKLLTRVLKLDLRSVFSVSAGSAWASSPHVRNGEVGVRVCGRCSKATQDFAELYQQFEQVRLKVEGSVETIRRVMMVGTGTEEEKMKGDDELRRRRQYNQKRLLGGNNYYCSPEELIMTSLWEKLRREVVLKCGHFAKSTFPWVELQDFKSVGGSGSRRAADDNQKEATQNQNQNKNTPPPGKPTTTVPKGMEVGLQLVLELDSLPPHLLPSSSPSPEPPLLFLPSTSTSTSTEMSQDEEPPPPNISFKKVGSSGRVQCSLCSKVLSSTGSIANHKLSHCGSMSFGCELCPMSFRYRISLFEHKCVSHGSTLLGAAKDPRASPAQFENAIASLFSSLVSSTRVAGVSVYPCLFCASNPSNTNITYRNKGRLIGHLIRTHSAELASRLEILQENELELERASSTRLEMDPLEMVEVEITTAASQEEQPQQFITFKKLDSDSGGGGGGYPCDLCSKSFRSTSSLAEHNYLSHPWLFLQGASKDVGLDEPGFQSAVSRLFRSLLSPKKHVVRVDGVVYQCPFCRPSSGSSKILSCASRVKMCSHLIRKHEVELVARLQKIQESMVKSAVAVVDRRGGGGLSNSSATVVVPVPEPIIIDLADAEEMVFPKVESSEVVMIAGGDDDDDDVISNSNVDDDKPNYELEPGTFTTSSADDFCTTNNTTTKDRDPLEMENDEPDSDSDVVELTENTEEKVTQEEERSRPPPPLIISTGNTNIPAERVYKKIIKPPPQPPNHGHKLLQAQGVNPLGCPSCGVSFLYPVDLARHNYTDHRADPFLQHNKDPTLSSAEFEKLVETLLAEHLVRPGSRHASLCCTYCGIIFAGSALGKSRLYAHYVLVHMEQLVARLKELQQQQEAIRIRKSASSSSSASLGKQLCTMSPEGEPAAAPEPDDLTPRPGFPKLVQLNNIIMGKPVSTGKAAPAVAKQYGRKRTQVIEQPAAVAVVDLVGSPGVVNQAIVITDTEDKVSIIPTCSQPATAGSPQGSSSSASVVSILCCSYCTQLFSSSNQLRRHIYMSHRAQLLAAHRDPRLHHETFNGFVDQIFEELNLQSRQGSAADGNGRSVSKCPFCEEFTGTGSTAEESEVVAHLIPSHMDKLVERLKGLQEEAVANAREVAERAVARAKAAPVARQYGRKRTQVIEQPAVAVVDSSVGSSEDVGPPPQRRPRSGLKIRCEFCPRSFIHQDDVRKHAAKGHKFQIFQSYKNDELCGGDDLKYLELLNPLVKSHIGKTSGKEGGNSCCCSCDICHNTFPSEEDAEAHVVYCHEVEIGREVGLAQEQWIKKESNVAVVAMEVGGATTSDAATALLADINELLGL